MRRQQIHDLLESEGAALRLFATQWCHWPDDAVQEAFIDLVDVPVWPDNPRAWLYAATRNKAKNLGRAERRRATRQQRVAEHAQDAWFSDSHRSPVIDQRELQTALEQLDPDERQIVVARVWGEMKLEELADLVSCSTSAVHRRYHAAIAKLRRQLEVENATDQ
ncbi:RNA polymerase sigma factor [Allorhodopirellula solitaria]|uniref:RNA polymerase sigma factor n=1 Tax=Allorhodopirellula solitaria TaxID=2527987 RepID=A0A5C5YJZ9_9BACT|nr:sigma-70 family RNA polymerase sigma factor [Allorhodopirellula solitaria]TWT75233.1 RNA polymerase sigma factor [Allorhodopirellula solitaria]